MRFKVRVYVSRASVSKPSDEVRKLDSKLFVYKKRVGGTLMYTPIPPASLRGALRHAAYIASRVLGGDYEKVYEELFGSDPRFENRGETPVTKRGKVIVTLEEGLTREELKRLTEVRPRVRIDATKGSVAEGALMFYEAVAEIGKPLVYSIEFEEEPSEEELNLLRAALRLLKGWGVGGRSTLGFGLVKEIEFEEV